MNKMKHVKMIKHIFCITVTLVLAALFPLYAQSIRQGSKITVGVPSMQNGGSDDAWMPLFVQGQLTTDFQNYSGLIVIDRQAVKQLLEEQKIKEQNAYLTGSEDEIQYASLVEADYVLSVTLIKTGPSYSLSCSIQDVKFSSIVGKVYSAVNLSESRLSDGSAIHAASYDLLKSIGVPESILASLKASTASQNADVAANLYTAKGMAVEQSGGSIVQAMAYYQKAVGSSSKITEAAQCLDGLTSRISGVNVGTVVLNDIQLRNQWKKIWADMYEYAKENWVNAVYDPSLVDMTNINYDKETADLVLPVAVRLNPEVHDLWYRLIDAYEKTPKKGNWNLKEATWDFLACPRKIKMAVYNEDDVLLGYSVMYFKITIDAAAVNIKKDPDYKYYYEYFLYPYRLEDYGKYLDIFWTTFRFVVKDVDPNDITGSLTFELIPNCEGGMIRAMKSVSIN